MVRSTPTGPRLTRPSTTGCSCVDTEDGATVGRTGGGCSRQPATQQGDRSALIPRIRATVGYTPPRITIPARAPPPLAEPPTPAASVGSSRRQDGEHHGRPQHGHLAPIAHHRAVEPRPGIKIPACYHAPQ